MRREAFKSTPDTEARLLCLIDAFSRKQGGTERLLEGRTKLAKLDFFLRYPLYLVRALRAVGAEAATSVPVHEASHIEDRMMRYRYGPWDPQYFSALGSLLGRGLIIALPTNRGFGYRTTEKGERLAADLLSDEAFAAMAISLGLLRRYFDWSGNRLKNFVYELVPEVTDTPWTESVP